MGPWTKKNARPTVSSLPFSAFSNPSSASPILDMIDSSSVVALFRAACFVAPAAEGKDQKSKEWIRTGMGKKGERAV